MKYLKKVPIFLFLFFFIRLILNTLFPLTDPSESRYALICRIMAESGNFLEPRFFHEGVLMNFEGKPPLYFQMGALACKIFGVNLFSIRLPATIFSSILLSMMFYTVRVLKNERVALFSVILCMISPVFFYLSGAVMTDMALACTVCCAVFSYILFEYYFNQRRYQKIVSLGLFISLSLGMLVKGPVALVMSGIPIFLYILYTKHWKNLKKHSWFLGFTIFFAIAAPWYIMMQIKNPDFFEYFFINENFKRFLFKEYGDQYGAGRESFRGMSILFTLLACSPAIFLVFIPFIQKKHQRNFFNIRNVLKNPLLGLSLFSVLGITGFWGLTSRVLITYVLPVIPFFCIWIAVQTDEYFPEIFSSFIFKRIVIIFFSCMVIVFATIQFFAPKYITVMPGKTFKQILTLFPENKENKFYFYKKIPYSASYYMQNRIFQHPGESASVSEENSQKYLLVCRLRDYKKYPLKQHARKIIFQNNTWIVLAPTI